MKKWETIILGAVLALLVALFGVWAFTEKAQPLANYCSGILSLVLFALCVARAVPGLKPFFTSSEPPAPDAELGERSLRGSRRHPWLNIIIWVILTRIAVYIAAYCVYTIANGYSGGLFNAMERMWVRTDAPHYIGIAQNWYQTQGDARLHLVFFPLYPIIISFFDLFIGNTFASAMVVSNLFSIGAAIAAYELAAIDMDRAGALRMTRYLFLLPGAFFFAAPMSESLFVFLCLLCIYLIRKKRYLWGCLAGGLAAFTRSPGVLLAVPVFMEYVRELVQTRRAGDKPLFLRRLWGRGACLFLIPLGLIGYLFVNYAVSGNPFQFMIYQWENWHQRFGLFFNTAAYQMDYAFKAAAGGNWGQLFGLWLPNLIAVFGSLGIMLKGAKKLRPSYTAYFLVYFVMTIGATWLLSAPRYLAAAFPLAFVIADLTKKKAVDWVVSALLVVCYVVFMGMFVLGYPIY